MLLWDLLTNCRSLSQNTQHRPWPYCTLEAASCSAISSRMLALAKSRAALSLVAWAASSSAVRLAMVAAGWDGNLIRIQLKGRLGNLGALRRKAA